MKKEKLPRGIRRRGNSLIVVFALKDGTIERRSLGPVGVVYAKEQLAIYKREVREGHYEKRQPKMAFYSIANLWEAYLRDYRNRGGKDEGRLEIAWNHLKQMFQAQRVEEISTDSINRYIESRRGQGIKNGTINREIAVLRAMFQHGTRVTPPMVDRLPAFPTRLKESEPRQGFIEDPQYAALAAHAKATWMRAFIECAYSFGFRRGELLDLRVGAVDLLERWIHLSGAETKNGKPRKVKMTAKVFDLVCACVRGKKPEAFVFTRDDGSRVVDPREDWYNLCVAAGLGKYVITTRRDGEAYQKYKGIQIHDFRRSAIRNMIRRGISDNIAMKISGHRTRSIFDRYNIGDEKDLAKAAQLIEEGGQNQAKSDSKTDTPSFAHS